jgi:hypothetical protein
MHTPVLYVVVDWNGLVETVCTRLVTGRRGHSPDLGVRGIGVEQVEVASEWKQWYL